jgi:DNA-binding NarL/FixJ family response regulator
VIKVVVADDETLFRSGLAMIVGVQDDLDVVAEAKDGHQAVEAVRRHRPDVVLMDIQMPGLDGIKATKEIVRLELPTRVLILTTFGIDRNVYAALRAGASGFLLKTVPPNQLVEGVRVVAGGDMLLAPGLTRRLIEELVHRPVDGIRDSRLTGLTEREAQVLALVGQGLSNAEIATTLSLSVATVKSHVGHLLAKTGARDRVQAVVLAYRTGLVQPADLLRDA